MNGLNWERLLSTQRLRMNEAGEVECYDQSEQSPRTPAEADIQRIIFSAPFRRLAGKTQVHPLAKVDYVHNRLTHSLEVAEIGTGLTQSLVRALPLTPEQAHACVLHVKAACLGHDIGNPPYGHAGEYAIQSWVECHQEILGNLLAEDAPMVTTEDAARTLEDFRKFDGNAQAFRLLSQPDPRGDAYYRLSFASLGALMKYPRCACDTHTAKYSCFHTARPVFDHVVDTLGLRTEKDVARHPLSYLTEIADDIAYCVTDCEDAILMGILKEERVTEWYLNLFENAENLQFKPGVTVSFLRARVIGDLVRCFTDDLIQAFQTPERLADFETASPTWQRLHTLKERYRVVFDDAAKIQKELRAQAEIHRTLDAFLSVLKEIHSDRPTYATALLRKYTFGEAMIERYKERSNLWWLHTVFDYITGMTDRYLHDFSNNLP